VVGGNSANGINVRQWDYSDRKAVHWKLYTDDEGNYVLVSSTGDKVLDLTGAKSTAGTNVWTWDYYGASTQEWKLNKVEKSPISYLKQVTVSNGWYTFASIQDESYVLDVNGYSKNSNLRLYKKNDSENQKFYIESVGNNEYKIKTGASNGNLVLNAVNGNNTAGDNVNQYSYDDSIKDEKWKIYQDTSGNYVFVSSTGDKVLDICGKKMANDTNIWLWEYYGANTQKWKLNPVNVKEGQEIADGTYTIGLASNNNYVFDVSYCSSKNGTKIQLMNRNGNIAQLFRIKYEGNGEYTINTGASLYNSSVDILGGNTTNATINQWANNSLAPQRWKITKSGNGYVFRSVINENLVLDASGASNGASLTLATYNANDNTQKFTLTKGSGWLISGDRKYYFNENGNKPEVGIDVSYHNGTIDWQKVKDDNISYAIIRSGYRTEKTEGKRNIGKDVKFEENVANASKVGMEYGVYFYSTAVTIEEANEEADAIIAALKGKNPSRGVYIDIESTVVYNAKFGSIYNSTARRTITDVTKKVCQRLKDAGYSVGVYASESYFNNVLYTDELQGYMWVARYYSNTSNDQNTLDLNGKYPYKYWQYSSVGRVNGISTAVDMNTTVR
ncbi:MAG: RICIN domain-containing protein, partial [Lachnospiraceae bacterium]|nr:RICIN domain-containing protein [Lachnospiraceae bacterium]